MRDILFRGKDVDDGKWAEGCLLSVTLETCSEVEKKKYTHCIVQPDGEFYRGVIGYFNFVLPETVGQYTGINVGSEKLFEGDIVEWYEDYDDSWGYSQTAHGRSVVIWDKDNFCWAFETDKKYIQPFNDWYWNSSYIVGNIHDNPELLEGGGNG